MKPTIAYLTVKRRVNLMLQQELTRQYSTNILRRWLSQKEFNCVYNTTPKNENI